MKLDDPPNLIVGILCSFPTVDCGKVAPPFIVSGFGEMK